MILVSKTYWLGTPYFFKAPPKDARLESLTLFSADHREIRGLYWTPEKRPAPKVAAVIMHPRVDFSHHYTIPRLVEAGIACLAANTRNPNNDTTTVHEEILLDLNACVRFLKLERGVEHVVLIGNSGGGSLGAFFQSQATRAPGDRLATTPGGAATALPHAEMIPADALILISAHKGQGMVMNECIDPAVIDEMDPMRSDPSLDMYSEENGFVLPPDWSEYSDDFVARYRAAQLARVKRLDDRARQLIAENTQASELKSLPDFAVWSADERHSVLRREAFQPVMTIYRTMANPHYVDRHLDPSPREYGSLLSDRPDLMNHQILGFGRLASPHAWLSTWSGLSSNANLLRTLPEIRVPTLVVNAGRDREIYPSVDAKPIFDAVGAEDRTYLEFPEARHYFEPEFGAREAPDVEKLMDAVVPWIQERLD